MPEILKPLIVAALILAGAGLTTLAAYLFREQVKHEEGVPAAKGANLFTAMVAFVSASTVLSLVIPMAPELLIPAVVEILALREGKQDATEYLFKQKHQDNDLEDL